MRNLVILLGKRKIQGYLSDDDYEKIMSVIIEIQIKSMRAKNQKCTIGDTIKEAFLFYANHYRLIVKGTSNGVIPYYFKDSFFENVFEIIEKAENQGISTYNNQYEEWVRTDIFKIMEIRNEYGEKNNLIEIRDNNEQWKAIVDYITGIQGEFQEFKKEQNSKSDGKG